LAERRNGRGLLTPTKSLTLKRVHATIPAATQAACPAAV
jgi:hypothetical protein